MIHMKDFKEILLSAHYKLYPSNTFCGTNNSFVINVLKQITKDTNFDKLINVCSNDSKSCFAHMSNSDVIKLIKFIVDEVGVVGIQKIIDNHIATNTNKKLTYSSLWSYMVNKATMKDLKNFLKKYFELIYKYTIEVLDNYVTVYNQYLDNMKSTLLSMDSNIEDVEIFIVPDLMIGDSRIVFNYGIGNNKAFNAFDEINMFLNKSISSNENINVINNLCFEIQKHFANQYKICIDDINIHGRNYFTTKITFEHLITVELWPIISVECNSIYQILYKDKKYRSYFVKYIDRTDSDDVIEYDDNIYTLDSYLCNKNLQNIKIASQSDFNNKPLYNLEVIEISAPLTQSTMSKIIFHYEIDAKIEDYFNDNSRIIEDMDKDVNNLDVSHSIAINIYQTVMYNWHNKDFKDVRFSNILSQSDKIIFDAMNKNCNIEYFNEIDERECRISRGTRYRFLKRLGFYSDNKDYIDSLLYKIDDAINEYAHLCGFYKKLTSLLNISDIRVIPYLYWGTVLSEQKYIPNPYIGRLYSYKDSIDPTTKILFIHNRTPMRIAFDPITSILPIMYDVISTSKTKSAILSNFMNQKAIIDKIYEVCYSFHKDIMTDERFYNMLLDCLAGYSVYKNQLEYIKDMIDEYQKIDRMITSYLNDTYSNVIYNGNIHNTIREILYYSKIYEKDGAIFCKVEHLNHVDKENRCFVL